MLNHERAMMAYLRLADISQQKKQLLGRDKFLVLTGAAACRAGWPEVAQRCRELVLRNNAAHLIGKWETFPEALRSPEFLPFERQLERFCGYEKAEFHLDQLGVDRASLVAGELQDVGAMASEILSAGHWEDE